MNKVTKKMNVAHKHIVDAIKEKNMSAYKLAPISGLTYPTVRRFVTKTNINITLESYFKMCVALGVD